MAKFKFNVNEKNGSEFQFYEAIYSESTELFGDDIKYIPVENLVEDKIFGEFLKKNLLKAIDITLFIEETEGWGGGGMMMSKFGAQFMNQLTAYGSKSLFRKYNILPKSGDLLYIAKSDKIFQVENVTDETPFYLLGDLVSYKLDCTIYGFDRGEVNTDIPEVDEGLVDMADLMVFEENDKIEEVIVDKNVVDNTEKNNFFEE